MVERQYNDAGRGRYRFAYRSNEAHGRIIAFALLLLWLCLARCFYGIISMNDNEKTSFVVVATATTAPSSKSSTSERLTSSFLHSGTMKKKKKKNQKQSSKSGTCTTKTSKSSNRQRVHQQRKKLQGQRRKRRKKRGEAKHERMTPEERIDEILNVVQYMTVLVISPVIIQFLYRIVIDPDVPKLLYHAIQRIIVKMFTGYLQDGSNIDGKSE